MASSWNRKESSGGTKAKLNAAVATSAVVIAARQLPYAAAVTTGTTSSAAGAAGVKWSRIGVSTRVTTATPAIPTASPSRVRLRVRGLLGAAGAATVNVSLSPARRVAAVRRGRAVQGAARPGGAAWPGGP